MPMLPRDHAARRAALNPHSSYLVQAPAGSGKTELLTDRILALLPTVNQPEEIVAITFTRKAAAEMHTRVMQKLRAALQSPPEAPHARHSWELARAALEHDQRLGWQLLEFPARLSIQTIDAFCAALVQRMPYLSRLGGAARITEAPQELYLQASRETLALADDPDFGGPVRQLLSHLDVNTRLAAELLASMLASRDQWLPLLPNTETRQALEQNLQAAIEHELRPLLDTMPLGWQHTLPPLVRAACEYLAEHPDHELAALADWCDGEAFSCDASHLRQWRALSHLLLTKSGTPRARFTRTLGFPPNTKHKLELEQWFQEALTSDAWVDWLARVRHLPDGHYSDSQWHALTALFDSLRLAVAQLQVTFAEAGEVDFVEITQRALLALGESDDPSDLLLRLDRRIRHLLIDEFQDTSQPQIALLDRLTAGWEAGDGRTLFVVGDPMQSIYRFRKAEVSLFLEAAQRGIGATSLETLQLSVNFRSQAGIVDWVNETFKRLFPAAHDPDEGAISYAWADTFVPPHDGPAVQFHPIWRLDKEDLPIGVQEDERVVQLVIEALANGADSGREPNVAILVRAKSHAQTIARRLAQADIPYQAIELTTLADQPVVADLVQLARALAHPGDRLAWLCVLRAPWCGVSLRTLHELVGENHNAAVPDLLRTRLHQVTDAGDRQRLQHVVRALARAEPPSHSRASDAASGTTVNQSGPTCALEQQGQAKSEESEIDVADAPRTNESPQGTALPPLPTYSDVGEIPFAAWVETVWQRLGGPLVYPGRRNAADAESFFCLLEQQAPYGGLDPARLSEALQQLFAAPDPSPESSRVQIMTMHKSKGLQFDTVILPALHRRGRGEEEPLVRFEYARGKLLAGPIKRYTDAAPDPISQFLAQREARRAAHEVDRLLYVAVTRAKHKLHLLGEVRIDPASGVVKSPPSSTLLHRLWPFVSTELQVPTPSSCANTQDSDAPAQQAQPDGAQGTLDFGSAPEPPAAAEVAERRALALQRLPLDTIKSLLAQNVASTGQSETSLHDVQTSLKNSIGRVTGPTEKSTAHHRVSSSLIAADVTNRLETLVERTIGKVAHAWLEHVAYHDPQRWTPLEISSNAARIRTQLLRAGLTPQQTQRATEVVLDTLISTLNDPRGRWLLEQSAKREWRLLNRDGEQLIIDLAIEQDDTWLVVDYKTHGRSADETSEAFAQRVLDSYRVQLNSYCDAVAAATGKPAKAALYLPRAGLWLETLPGSSDPE